MKTHFTEATVFVCGLLLSLQTVKGWSSPLFCHGCECPEYRVVHTNENFEERFYNTSRWLMTEIQEKEPTVWVLKAAYDKLYDYTANEAMQVISATKPVAVTILKSTSGSEETFFVSLYVPPDTDLPKSTDSSITEYTLPAGTIFVRTFNNYIPDVQKCLDNLDTLEKDLKEAGKQYNGLRRMALGYEGPLQLFNRHDEVWIPAA